MEPILNSLRTLFLALLTSLLLLGFSPAGWADSAEPPAALIEPSAPSGVNANAISSEKISQFVQAYLQVVTLIDQREGELQGAETESDSLRIKQEIEAGAMRLIETEGLTFQEYLQLLTLANVDPEFSDRIVAQLQTLD
ncbi:MAG: DUF4168 domain-containing protein [Leptolyngbyaceae cyanobacterium CSU_1_4]|nr:DUF4168 domain-containing protein [Leptolyngbyaceae cyanobacterium CSU_1_4]